MTCSVGFRAPGATEIARELLPRLADDLEDAPGERPYRDPRQGATGTPGRVPEALRGFAAQALQRALRSPRALDLALGEALTEPKPRVWFEARAPLAAGSGVALDAGTRMLYDERHVFINGEALRAAGRDARLMRQLADQRVLGAADCGRLGAEALALLSGWVAAGWAHGIAG
jgi:50S ribosomal protein L16 3-hydroxylase